MRKVILLIVCILLRGLLSINAQSFTVSSSRLSFNETIGGYKSQLIRVTNNGSVTETFHVTFNNFNSEGNKGKTKIVYKEAYHHGCAQWLSASPAFFELAPGVTQDVEVILHVPNTPEANSIRWAVANVKLSKDDATCSNEAANETSIQNVQKSKHLIHIFQTPPTVSHKEAGITRFVHNGANASNQQKLILEVQNTGETILECAPHLDIVSLKTGETSRIKTRAFTILPQGKREVKFYLPAALAVGKYSILGIVNYGDNNDLVGAELEIDIK